LIAAVFTLAGFALRYKTIVVALVALIMGWGVFAYFTMPRREDPEYTVRTCVVSTSWPGTPTEKVEELVTKPLEEEIDTLDGIRWVRSDTRVGLSTIYVEVERQPPPAYVIQMWDNVRSRVERVPMPDPSLRPVVIDDFGQTNIMLAAVHQVPMPGEEHIRPEDRYSHRELDDFSDRLKDELKLLPGVAKVEREGVRQEVVYIETDLGTWTNLALTTTQISALLSARNVIATGGEIDTGVGRFNVFPTGNLNTEREIDSIVVGSVDKSPVYLRDLGLRVVRDYEDPPSVIARYGDPRGSVDSVNVAFTMKAGANITKVCAAARDLIHRLTKVDKAFPPDLEVSLVHDVSENVDRKINDFFVNVVEAVLIVVVVVFLMVGFRSAAVMAGNIPLVVLGSIALVTVFGVQLEQISIAAMIIALGMLVDNAVQICDQSRRLQSEGLSAEDAAIKGANQLSFPMLIATLTTVGAFFPMLLGLQGSTREYIYSLPVTITVVLLLSWVMAMTFCTLLAYWFIKAPKDPDAPLSPIALLFAKLKRKKGGEPAGEKKEGIFGRGYVALARVCLKARFLVVAISFGSLFFVMQLEVGSEFFPADIRDQFAIEVWLEEGSNVAQTDEATRKVEDLLRKLSPHTTEEGEQVERLRAYRAIVANGGARWYLGRNPEPAQPNYAEILVWTTDGHLTNDYLAEMRRIAEEGDEKLGLQPIVGARIIPRRLIMGPATEAPIGIRIYGAGFADMQVMREQGEKLKTLLRGIPGTWDVHDVWGAPSYQLEVVVDEDKANLAGVSNDSVAQTLNAYFKGHQLTTFREGDYLLPVYLRLPPEQRASLDELKSVYVEGLRGKVPLDAVASIEPRWEPAKIGRRFKNRMYEVRGRNEPGFRSNDLVNALFASQGFKDWEANLPSGYWWEVGGDMFESQVTAGELQVSILISLASIVLLLIIQYNGIGKPVIILTTLPLALIGAFLGLYVTGNALGFMPQLGLLSLFGIVVNTAIIFIEFADSLIEEKAKASDGSGPIVGLTKQEFRECLVQAGLVRLLPIAMTTLTTIGGLLPLALFGGPLWEGMAWLMIYGLAVATVLTLIVVPALYAIFVENFRMSPIPLEDQGDGAQG
jgi:multidrug efflux pump subunit AcrB